MTVRLAPREIRDLVYRSCRIAGCDAGVADRLSANILHAEIHRGGGLQSYLSALAGGSTAVIALARAADMIELAEVDARRNTSSTVSFDPPVPLAALSQTLWDAAARGAVARPEVTSAAGSVTIADLELHNAPFADEAKAAAQRREAGAFRNGIPVPESALRLLETSAADFLVAEATLDALSD